MEPRAGYTGRMMRIVVGQRGVKETISNVVRRATVTIGRDPSCDLVLKRSNVSRNHCRLFLINEFAAVEDLGSSNGTFVNGEPVKGTRVLNPTDIIVVGDYALHVESLLADSAEAERGSPRKGGTKTGAATRGSRSGGGKGRSREPSSGSKAGASRGRGSAAAWAVLGVTEGMSYAEVRKAYLALIAQYHPDIVAKAAPEIQMLADRRSKEINGAWNELRALLKARK